MNLSEMCIFRFACCSSHKYKEKHVLNMILRLAYIFPLTPFIIACFSARGQVIILDISFLLCYKLYIVFSNLRFCWLIGSGLNLPNLHAHE